MIHNFNNTDIFVIFNGQMCYFVTMFTTRYIMGNLEISPERKALFLLYTRDMWICNSVFLIPMTSSFLFFSTNLLLNSYYVLGCKDEKDGVCIFIHLTSIYYVLCARHHIE